MNEKKAKYLRRRSNEVYATTVRDTGEKHGVEAALRVPSPHLIYKELKRKLRVYRRDHA